MDVARIAGLFYLGMSVLFVTGTTVRARTLVSDPASTVSNMRASVSLLRAGMAADLISAALFLLTAMALYVLLRRVDERVAGAMLLFVVLGVAIGCFGVIAELSALAAATHSDYSSALGNDGAAALVAIFVETQRNGLLVNELFSGLWLLPLGYLVTRSGYFPAALGILLVVGGFAWIAQLFVQILLPDLARVASGLTLGAIGEVAFIGWLIVKGASV